MIVLLQVMFRNMVSVPDVLTLGFDRLEKVARIIVVIAAFAASILKQG